MQNLISKGQIFVDADGDEVEVVRVSRNGVTLRTAEDELVIASVDAVLQDIASGDLEEL